MRSMKQQVLLPGEGNNEKKLLRQKLVKDQVGRIRIYIGHFLSIANINRHNIPLDASK